MWKNSTTALCTALPQWYRMRKATLYFCALAAFLPGCGSLSFASSTIHEYDRGSFQLPADVAGRARIAMENRARYWNYRRRLLTQFMQPGLGPGRQLPADSIVIRGTRVNLIRWADATLQLGWYLGALALEYDRQLAGEAMPDSVSSLVPALLGARDAPDANETDDVAEPDAAAASTASATLREIYFGLMALDRLDRSAEPLFARVCDGPGKDEPGFFIRDDVADSPELRARFGRSWMQSDYATLVRSHCRPPRDCLRECPECFDGEASQDQMYHLLMGLALVERFVPAGTIVEGVELPAHARAQAEQMIQFLRRNNWELRNPVCGRPVRRGSFARGYSHATSRVAARFTNNRFVPPGSTCLWRGAGWSGNPLYRNPDNRHLALVLASVGNVWGPETFAEVQAVAAPEGWVIYPLLNHVLYRHGQPLPVELGDTALAMLAQAPPDGPAFDGGHANGGWSASNRFLRGRDRQLGGGANFGSVYNGLDYMLLYGLTERTRQTQSDLSREIVDERRQQIQ